MLDFQREQDCCGCGACANICPANAIVMKSYRHGFLMPEIRSNLCVGCGKCDSVCPVLNTASMERREYPESCWIYASQDNEIKLRSSSGGAFYEIARAMMDSGAYVAGCAWGADWKAVHILGETEVDLRRMQGSKYVQSDSGGVYQAVLEKLRKGLEVVFSGTPCQAVAMDRFLQVSGGARYREKLLNIAIICHGVSSPAAWESYKTYLEETAGSELAEVNFRDKTIDGYRTSYAKYTFVGGGETYLPTYLPSFPPSFPALRASVSGRLEKSV